MTKWSFSQNIFLIINHLDLIFYHLLTCFYLNGRKKNRKENSTNGEWGSFANILKKDSQKKLQQKDSKTLKMSYYHLARQNKLRMNEYLGKTSQHYTQRRKAGHYI